MQEADPLDVCVAVLLFMGHASYRPPSPQQIPSSLSCSASKNCGTPCAPAKITKIAGIPFCNISLIPSWLLAVAIGLLGAHTIMTRVRPAISVRSCYYN